MQELYSKAEDCYELYKLLKKKMGTKIECDDVPYTETFSGRYFSYDREPHSDLDYLYERGISFYYKFCKNVFLRIGVGNALRHYTFDDTSVGEKLAALSDFYEVLSEEFGEPTVFYTTKDDEDDVLAMQWSFINKEEEIQQFKDGTYFDDAEIDKLVVFDESKYPLNDATRKYISRKLGIPLVLLPLVNDNIEEFVKYKNRNNAFENADTSEMKLSLEKN